MTLDQVIAYGMAKSGAYLDYPFTPFFPVIRVKTPSRPGGRIFAQPFLLRGEPKLTVYSTPAAALMYRQRYPHAVARGWHCPPVQQPYFNTVDLGGAVPDEAILRMIDHAYEAAVAKLPKYAQEELHSL
ncbi:MAG: MmcQ/YjbR family DNA-binding protein [Firmicutes bacterium]|nr:MmcQ/YjbR family DNA-binding protein [Bacillota bacterium]